MDYDEDIYPAILAIIEEKREGEIVSTALIRNEVKENPDLNVSSSEITEAVEELVILGELTLIWAQQEGRLILNKSAIIGDKGQATLVNGIWRCYIAKDHQESYHSGLFESKSAAKGYLRKVVGDDIDNLESVPFCNNVHALKISGFEGYGTHTVVIRGEHIRHQLRLKE